MRALFDRLLDLLFPPEREALMVRSLTHADVRALMKITTHEGTVALLPYRDDRVRALIWRAKYKEDPRAAALLGTLLGTYLRAQGKSDAILIPIPLSSQRLRERGYNQVTRIAEVTCKDLPHITLRNDLLVRTTHRTRQTTLSRNERLENMHGVFRVVHGDAIFGQDVILLDDVTTTGATLHEAAHTLRSYRPARITTIALAH